MKDEIKEILNNMKKHLEKHKEDYQIIVVENGFSGDSITYELYYDDLNSLLDYIINLQDTLKDREEYCYGLETQITNLQEENRLLKMDKLEKQFPNLNAVKVEIDTYKSRNEKAIDYIKEHNVLAVNKEYIPREYEYFCSADLLNILEGSDK